MPICLASSVGHWQRNACSTVVDEAHVQDDENHVDGWDEKEGGGSSLPIS